MRALNERGVAMVTVLLVGAALTALTSAAAFVTIEEFGATQADKNAAQALSYAEAGIDRLVLKIRNGDLTWNDLSSSGCSNPAVTINGAYGSGSYVTRLEVFDNRLTTPPGDRFVPTSCVVASTSPRGLHAFVITSTGTQPQAQRVIRQVIEIKPLGLPIGIYAYDSIEARGSVNLENISMVSEGVILNRDNLHFRGTDPYYTLADFYGSRVTDVVGVARMPAAVHAKGASYYGAASKTVEHRAGFEPNCEANRSPGTAGQSLWDGSGTAALEVLATDCVDWPGSNEEPDPAIVTSSSFQPPTSKFTEDDRRRVAPTPTLSEQDYLTLRTAARQSGLYCSGSTALTLSCTKAGGPVFALTAGKLDAQHIDGGSNPANPITSKSFVVYIEFDNNGLDPFTRKLTWSGGAANSIGPCTTNPATSLSGVIVVRRGTIDFSGSSTINGALLVPEGAVESSGGFTMEGTIIARRIYSVGNATIRLSSCWVRNIPGPFLDVTATAWTEVDR